MNWSDWLDKIKKNWIISSAIIIVIGLLLVIFQEKVMMDLHYIIAGISIALGVVRIVTYYKQDHTYPFIFQTDLLLGLLILGLGLFALLPGNGDIVNRLVPSIFGVVLIGCGVGNILRAVDAYKAGVRLWGLMLGVAIVTLALGWVVMLNPFVDPNVTAILIGAGLILEGISDIVIVLLAGKKIEAWRTSTGRSVS